LNLVKSVNNCYQPAWQARGQIVDRWGKDQTGLIAYQFNQQGFRHHRDYNWKPDMAIFGNSIVFGVGVEHSDILCNLLPNTQNYGLSGNYMNHHSVSNLREFVASDLYSTNVKIVFFWIDRDEPIDDMIQKVNTITPGVLHISSGIKRSGAINLMQPIDQDVSKTHPGPRTHQLWANTIKLLIERG
jgi:hypothetical protein